MAVPSIQSASPSLCGGLRENKTHRERSTGRSQVPGARTTQRLLRVSWTEDCGLAPVPGRPGAPAAQPSSPMGPGLSHLCPDPCFGALELGWCQNLISSISRESKCGRKSTKSCSIGSGARDAGNAETSPILPAAPAPGPSGTLPLSRLHRRSALDAALQFDRAQSGSELAPRGTRRNRIIALICMNFGPNRR